jgi:hypothetical protein
VRVTLTATGNVAEVVPVFTRSGHPNGTGLKPKELERFAAGCREGVLAAAKKIRFEPAMKDGQPVTQHVTIFYDSWGL